MKYLLPLLLFITTLTFSALAQTSGEPGKAAPIIHICAPSRGQLVRQPMYVIIFKGKAIFTSDTIMTKNMGTLNLIQPRQIETINILKDKNATARYGDMAKNGVIEVTLNDKKFPKAWKSFRPDSIRIKLKQDSIARSLRPDTTRYRR